MPSDSQPTNLGLSSDATAPSGMPPVSDTTLTLEPSLEPSPVLTNTDPFTSASEPSATADSFSASPTAPLTAAVDPATGLPAEPAMTGVGSMDTPAPLNDPASTDPFTSASEPSATADSFSASPTAPLTAAVDPATGLANDLNSTVPASAPSTPFPAGDNASVLNPAPATTFSDSGGSMPPAGGGSDNIVASPHVPQKYGGKKVIATIFGILLMVGAVAAGVSLVGRIQELREKASSGTGNIAIFKFICDKIGDQDVCNGRDTSLGNYKVDFQVHEGTTDQGPVVQTITVTLSDNQNGNGNTGNASQGRSVGGVLNTGSYTVCEIPIAYNATGDRVPLEVEPRPEASHGGSSGGTNQKQFNSNCITVDLNAGEAELKYLDKRKGPAPTPTAAPTSTPTPTKPPQATNTVTPKPTVTPTLPPQISAECFDVVVYNTNWQQLSANDLSSLKSGDKIRLTIAGQTSSGSFSKARFTVNGTAVGETTTKKPSSDSYYIEYTIPTGTNSFTVKGELYHSSLGWI